MNLKNITCMHVVWVDQVQSDFNSVFREHIFFKLQNRRFFCIRRLLIEFYSFVKILLRPMRWKSPFVTLHQTHSYILKTFFGTADYFFVCCYIFYSLNLMIWTSLKSLLLYCLCVKKITFFRNYRLDTF